MLCDLRLSNNPSSTSADLQLATLPPAPKETTANPRKEVPTVATDPPTEAAPSSTSDQVPVTSMTDAVVGASRDPASTAALSASATSAAVASSASAAGAAPVVDALAMPSAATGTGRVPTGAAAGGVSAPSASAEDAGAAVGDGGADEYAEAEAESRARLNRVAGAFQRYRSNGLRLLDRKAQYYQALPDADRLLLRQFPLKLSRMAEAVEINASLIEAVVHPSVAPMLHMSTGSLAAAVATVGGGGSLGTRQDAANGGGATDGGAGGTSSSPMSSATSPSSAASTVVVNGGEGGHTGSGDAGGSGADGGHNSGGPGGGANPSLSEDVGGLSPLAAAMESTPSGAAGTLVSEEAQQLTAEEVDAARLLDEDLSAMVDVMAALTRDWSEEGRPEREAVYNPLLAAVEEAFMEAEGSGLLSDSVNPRSAFRVLVPGAAYGRLAWELARAGFAVQGSESNLFALLASNWVLNAPRRGGVGLYPYAHQVSHVRSEAEQLRPVVVPDVDPRALPAGADFSMRAGDFLDVFCDPAEAGAWDCVATSFFLGTAHNVVASVRTISSVLKGGGVWTSLSPLNFKYADLFTEPSVELTEEELLRVICLSGFRILRKETRRCTYGANAKSLSTTFYDCLFFVAIKVR
ncbi:hypothetical protein MMPV_008424 [Pyropia vietnamensis]